MKVTEFHNKIEGEPGVSTSALQQSGTEEFVFVASFLPAGGPTDGAIVLQGRKVADNCALYIHSSNRETPKSNQTKAQRIFRQM